MRVIVLAIWGIFYWLGLAQCALANPAPALAPLDLANASMVQLTPSNVQYLVQTENITTQHILDQPHAQPWKMVDKPSINLGKSTHSMWVRFTIKNSSAMPINKTLEIRWIHLAQLDWYQWREDGSVATYRAGLNLPPEQLYKNNRHILLPITLNPHEQSDVLMRVKTSFIAFLPMFVWDEETRQESEFFQYIAYSVAFGVLVAMMLYNASLYVFTRDKSYFYYSLYVAGIIMYQLGATGIGVYAIWGEFKWMRLNGFALSIYMSFLLATFFVRHFLDLKTHGGFLLGVNTFLACAWAVVVFDLLLGSNVLRSIADLLSLLTILFATYTAIVLWRKGNVSARYFTLAWSFIIVSTFITLLMMEGVVPHSAMTEYGQMVGFVLEVLLLSFAMAERINRERLYREKAQADALRMQVLMGNEREQKMAAQEELLSMQKRTNAELEEKVSERTEELERTMTNLEIANRELAKLSVTDPLTKVHNRRYFDEVLHREIARSQRTQQPLGLILVDIDRFKQFNDRYGHLVGDDCLRLVASVLQNEVSRVSDLVARYGGEEFAVILPDASEEEAMSLAEKIRIGIRDLEFIYRGERIPISASLGVVGQVPSKDCSSVSFIGAADKALYRAKDLGRNRCVSVQMMR